jgi:hypothetical protein
VFLIWQFGQFKNRFAVSCRKEINRVTGRVTVTCRVSGGWKWILD